MLLCCQLGTLTSDSEWAINEGHILGKLANINFVMDFAAPVAGRVRFVLTVCLYCLRRSLRVLELSVEVRRWPPGNYGELNDVALYIFGPEMVGCSVIAAR